MSPFITSSDISFYHLRRRMTATRNFTRTEKILFLARVIEFSNPKNTCNYIAHANFNRDFPKINFKIYLLLEFLR